MGQGMEMARKRVLVVEDDASVLTAVAEFLMQHEFCVATACDGEEASAELARCIFDLAVVDIMLPGEDGLSLCRRFNELGLPVLIVSALSSTAARIAGLETGAADYLPKPFDPRELLARIRAILRRNPRSPPEGSPSHNFAGLRFNARDRILTRPDGVPIALTAHEFRLLAAFVDRPGRLLSRGTLLDLTSLGEEEPYERAVDLAVSRLRRKLRASDGGEVIETVRGLGYRFVARIETE